MQILLDMTKPWLGKVGALSIQKEDASFRHTLTKRKIQGWTSPGLLRKGRSGAEKRTRSVSLRSNSIFQHRPSIPPLTPLRLGRFFLDAKALRCCLFVFGFRFVLFAKVLRCWLFVFGFRFVLFFSPRHFVVGFLLCFDCMKKAPSTRGKRGLDILVSVFTWRNLRHVSLWLL